MQNNWSEKQTQFWKEGYTIFDNLFPNDTLEYWREQVNLWSSCKDVEGINNIHKKFDVANIEARDGVGEYKFISIDGRACLNENGVPFKGLSEYYNSFSILLSLFTGLDIVTSWDKQSAITFMNYTAPGGTVIPHFDTNGFTLLLYLTDNPNEGATQLYPLTSLRPTILGSPDEIIGEPILIYPKVNRAVFFQGRRCWHQSLSVTKANKISSVWNYYERDDNWRPTDVSKRLYSK